MLNVCHLTTSFLLPHGPSGGILAQIRHQDRTRVRSTVWSLYAPPSEFDGTAVLRQQGVDHRSLGMSHSFVDLRVIPRLVAALRYDRPDVLHCHLVRANLYGRVAAGLAQVPVIISTIRNVEDYMTSGGMTSRTVRFVESKTSAWVSAYVAVSETVRRVAIEALRLPRAKIETILNAVDLDPYRQTPDRLCRRPVVIGTAGSLDLRKNHAFLIRAMQRVSDARLLIAGEGPERANLRALIHELALDDVVTLVGLVRDIPAFLASLDVFVMTSTHEGLPRALMEAMASGLPALVTDAGGTTEAVGDGVCGYVVPTGDLEAFVARLRTLVADADLRRQLGAAARRRAFETFSAERMAGEYTALYERLAP